MWVLSGKQMQTAVPTECGHYLGTLKQGEIPTEYGYIKYTILEETNAMGDPYGVWAQNMHKSKSGNKCSRRSLRSVGTKFIQC